MPEIIINYRKLYSHLNVIEADFITKIVYEGIYSTLLY